MRIRGFDGISSALAGRAAPISPWARWSAWRRGFSGWSWVTYELDRNDPDEYLPDTAMKRLSEVNGGVGKTLLRNKLLFSSVVGAELRAPATLGIVDRGRVVPLVDGFETRDSAGLVEYCASSRGVVLKPADSSEGRRVHSLEVEDGQVRFDKRPANQEEIEERISRLDGMLITEMIGQASYAESIFPDAVNTMRIVTMIDPADDQPFVAAAVHRFGTRRSVPTDNASRGGLSARIDMETGALSALSPSWTYRDGAFAAYARHPETGQLVEGVTVPAWGDVKRFVLDAVRRYPFWRYVGWDVLIDDGGVRIMEGNHAPSLATQRTNPYRADPRASRFLQHHGVIGPDGTVL